MEKRSKSYLVKTKDMKKHPRSQPKSKNHREIEERGRIFL